MQVGNIVKSLKGHDTDRVYLVLAVLNENFVLIADGKYRKLDNPKQKRVRHLTAIGVTEAPEKLDDATVRKICKLFQEGDYAEGR